MADMKRYEKRVNPINGDVYMACVSDGAYVLYDDHVAALAQQAGADYRHVATISQTQFGFYWIDWHENVAYRKGLKLFASSAPGGGGEVS